MTRWQIISFDVQGTLTSGVYSDTFWQDFLPNAYAQSKNLPLAQAQMELRTLFTQFGKQSVLYHDADAWLQKCTVQNSLADVLENCNAHVQYNSQALNILQAATAVCAGPVIALSSTTRSFLDLELAGLYSKFAFTYSTVNDFGMCGKPPAVYTQLAHLFEVDPRHCLHIGDDHTDDVENAREALWHAYLWPQDADKLLNILQAGPGLT